MSVPHVIEIQSLQHIAEMMKLSEKHRTFLESVLKAGSDDRLKQLEAIAREPLYFYSLMDRERWINSLIFTPQIVEVIALKKSMKDCRTSLVQQLTVWMKVDKRETATRKKRSKSSSSDEATNQFEDTPNEADRVSDSEG